MVQATHKTKKVQSSVLHLTLLPLLIIFCIVFITGIVVSDAIFQSNSGKVHFLLLTTLSYVCYSLASSLFELDFPFVLQPSIFLIFIFTFPVYYKIHFLFTVLYLIAWGFIAFFYITDKASDIIEDKHNSDELYILVHSALATFLYLCIIVLIGQPTMSFGIFSYGLLFSSINVTITAVTVFVITMLLTVLVRASSPKFPSIPTIDVNESEDFAALKIILLYNGHLIRSLYIGIRNYAIDILMESLAFTWVALQLLPFYIWLFILVVLSLAIGHLNFLNIELISFYLQDTTWADYLSRYYLQNGDFAKCAYPINLKLIANIVSYSIGIFLLLGVFIFILSEVVDGRGINERWVNKYVTMILLGMFLLLVTALLFLLLGRVSGLFYNFQKGGIFTIASCLLLFIGITVILFVKGISRFTK